MNGKWRFGILAAVTPLLCAGAIDARAQAPAGAPAPSWHFSQDGLVQVIGNHQGGPRGGDEVVVPNWWMGVLSRAHGRQQFGLTTMFSLDAATVGRDGYRELFQVGETLNGAPLVDRQHPHDFFMQLAGSWRIPVGERAALVLAGGPSGEPTLGPVAFMHRPSAAGLPFAPLGHHTFDSTHVSFGVVTASLGIGRWSFEGSAFNGREPDEHRWDFDFGALDSFAGRVWFRPAPRWEVQVSSGHLTEPEVLEPGDVQRTTASASWFAPASGGLTAVTAGYGVNAAHGQLRQGLFAEGHVERGPHAWFGRFEVQQVETDVLLTGGAPDPDDHDEAVNPPSTVVALTLGASRRIFTWKGFDGALTGQVVFHATPSALEPAYGPHPVSFQVLFRLRLPAPGGRMWNMKMSQGHTMETGHAGHHMQ